ncbi:TetR/AcrR family transcriptional regulator [Mycobacterium sp. TNTM28]|uniref:TetR/AcrR family transcriptional regulator n=1 Tax=[Mycobacterium] fortunisiensis TaxID=2600579 RepID=A0ABS6KQ41_9MYCO|nr:TetR family transcriptional regulator [[Mycobacterium] fortunisiensis]MBU9765676.1 TetR/AcrR family transcriptional regulator [[Mycobacterium] fortunisiensis]
MARTADPGKREALLNDVVDYLEQHGIGEMSLAPMAQALGTSKRMLLYYFGDRAELLAQALEASRPQLGEMFAGVTSTDEFVAAARTLWRELTRGGERRNVRLLLQVLSLAITDPQTYGAAAQTSVEVMIDPIAATLTQLGYGVDDARARATLVVSGLRGLFQDSLVTEDRSRVDAAAALLIAAAVG